MEGKSEVRIRNRVNKMITIKMGKHSTIFLFKQKTAYEMRISDGSSDVCSSDLVWCERAPGCISRISRLRPAVQPARWMVRGCWQIGRASCRERVCPYV